MFDFGVRARTVVMQTLVYHELLRLLPSPQFTRFTKACYRRDLCFASPTNPGPRQGEVTVFCAALRALLLTLPFAQAIILVPQSASIGELFINRSFIETHVVLLSPDGSGRLMSVNGVRALFLNPER